MMKKKKTTTEQQQQQKNDNQPILPLIHACFEFKIKKEKIVSETR